MKSNKQIIGLLKAIYFVAISIALVLIGYVISGGQTNTVSVLLVYAGVISFFIGAIMGIVNFGSSKDDSK